MRHAASATFRTSGPSAGTERFAFLLLDGFTHLAFSCAVEPLRLANLATGKPVYKWRVLTTDGGPAKSSAGISVQSDGRLHEVETGELLVVVGGRPAPPSERDYVIPVLRREQAHGRRIMGICGGVTLLAEAGILRGLTCAVHWQVAQGFKERFPHVEASLAAFELGRVPTASGGTAAADLFLALIREGQGPELARNVADLMVHHAIRESAAPQTSSLMYHVPGRNAKLASIIRRMEATLDAPLSAPELAAAAGLSVRQMERLFRRYIGTTPNKHYNLLRLNRARDLLVQTDLSITEISVATGFLSQSHFAKRFKAQFGVSAYVTREQSYETSPYAL